jgi:anti-sigma regulatory factor (Ser/Thr protein kinase)
MTTEAPPSILVRDEADVSAVRQLVREQAAQAGLPTERGERLVAASSELAHNQIAHALRGEVLVRPVMRQGTAGVEVIARDGGGGIKDPTAALRSTAPSTASLGVGLGAAYRLADEVDFDVRWDEGTRIAARTFATPLPRSEVAILGRPCDGERVSGDDALFQRRGAELLLAVTDGLGHGPPAQEAAHKAIEAIASSSATAPLDLLQACHPALAGTRGTVMAVVTVTPQEGGARLRQAGVGNISCHVYQHRTSFRLPSTPGVLGQPGPKPRIQEQSASLTGRYLLLLFTDGLSSRLDLSEEAALLREPPLLIAHHLLLTHGRGHDDNLVLVATG